MTPRLAALVRRELVRPDRPQLPREDAYRFRHLLIRDAAYDALPKATRADLHRRFAEWLEEHGQSLVELDEILGYHLEQAARLPRRARPARCRLAELASGRSAAAGSTRALARRSTNAAHSLLERAVRLVEQTRTFVWRSRLQLSHSGARDAEPLLEEAARRADADGDAAGAALARTLAGVIGALAAAELGRMKRSSSASYALPLLEAKRGSCWSGRGLVRARPR